MESRSKDKKQGQEARTKSNDEAEHDKHPTKGLRVDKKPPHSATPIRHPIRHPIPIRIPIRIRIRIPICEIQKQHRAQTLFFSFVAPSLIISLASFPSP